MNQKEASALIIRNIQLLEEVNNHLVNVMDDSFCEAIDGVAEDIVKEWDDESGRKWDLSTGLFEGEIEFSPKAWRIAENDDEKRIAYYSTAFVKDADIACWDDEAKLFISSYVGISPLRAGFVFNFAYSFLNTTKQKSTWRAFSSSHILKDKIQSNGFIVLNDGNWFLPYQLNIETLAVAFAKDAIEDALDPIRNAINTIKVTHYMFEELVKDAIHKFGIRN